ncbi:MAG: transposase [Planctomycetota bacterium]|nr:transposase [Planctomycetota bacterium]MDA1140449.1 transposase [Planctomycetota bacterium]
MRKPRKFYTSKEKVAILKEFLVDRVPVSDVCDKHGIHPTVFYRWQKLFFENGEAAFDRTAPQAETRLERENQALKDKLQRKNEVLSELMEEHVSLKKTLGEI